MAVKLSLFLESFFFDSLSTFFSVLLHRNLLLPLSFLMSFVDQSLLSTPSPLLPHLSHRLLSLVLATSLLCKGYPPSLPFPFLWVQLSFSLPYFLLYSTDLKCVPVLFPSSLFDPPTSSSLFLCLPLSFPLFSLLFVTCRSTSFISIHSLDLVVSGGERERNKFVFLFSFTSLSLPSDSTENQERERETSLIRIIRGSFHDSGSGSSCSFLSSCLSY